MPVAVLVSTTSPVPCDLGKKVVLQGVIDHLVDRVGGDDVHFVLIGPPSSPPPPLPCQVHLLRAPTGVEQLRAAAGALVRRAPRSFQEAALASPRLARELGALLDELCADVEVFDTIRVGQFAEGRRPTARRVLHLGDLFSVRYERWLEAITAGLHAGAQPLGEFASLLPRAVRGPIGHWRVYRSALEVERRLVERRETEVVRAFDRTTLVSEEEAGALRTRAGVDTVVSIPPVVEGPPHVDRPAGGPPRFLFVGHLGVPHNVDALTTFLAAGPAPLRRACPGAQVTVVGRGASPELRSLAESWGDALVLHDYMPDVAPLLATSTAMLAPLRWGSGVKLKVLLALAHGCPVLGTSIAAQGIVPPTSTDGVVVEDDLSAWPEQLRRLSEPAVNRASSIAARRLWEERYSPAAAFVAYDGVFGLGGDR